MRIQFLFYIFCGLLTTLPAQALTTVAEQELLLIARGTPAGIQLRWAAQDAASLRTYYQRGFRIDRLAIDEATQSPIASSRQTIIDPLQAQGQTYWTALPDTAIFARALATFLYPEAPLPEEEEEMNYSFAVLAADHDFPAAEAAALAYLDKTAANDIIYQYELWVSGQPQALASVRALRNAASLLPPPQELKANPSQLAVEFSWHRARTERFYSSYALQRSDDGGKSFRDLNKLPLVQFLDDNAYDTLQYYRDSFPDLNKTYYYRLVGNTPFGDRGPYTEAIEVSAIPDPLLLTARIEGIVADLEENYRISWELPEAAPLNKVIGFQIMRSKTGLVDLRPQSDLLPPDTRNWTEKDPQDGYFYSVFTFTANDYYYPGSLKLLLIDDRTPPSPPTGLRGHIDSLGRVEISWEASPEADVSGYRVFNSHLEKGNYAQLTPRATPRTQYQHQVAMDILTRSSYYQVVAVDFAGNYSDFSEPLLLKKPDLHPPSPPNILKISGAEAGVSLKIASSSSEDVVAHWVERSPLDSEAWTPLDTLRSDSSLLFFTDSSGEPGRPYRYRIRAKDESNLLSQSDIFEGTRIDSGLRDSIRYFRAEVRAEAANVVLISWEYPPLPDLAGFQLYRAEGDGALLSLDFLSAQHPDLRLQNGRFVFLDRSVKAGRRYRYQLLAQFHSGAFSPLTPTQTIALP